MNNDYDYIGTGGFLLICHHGRSIGVTAEQSKRLQANSSFFYNCLQKDMQEKLTKQIRKPDWSLAVARHLVEVMNTGRTTCSSLQVYRQVVEAADQICLDLGLCNFVNYQESCSTVNRFWELVEQEKYRFTLHAKVLSQQWLELLAEKDVLLHRRETNYVVELQRDCTSPETPSSPVTSVRRQLAVPVSEFLIHADHSIHALQCIANSLGGTEPGKETYSIYFETNAAIPKSQHELIDRLAGGHAYIRTCPDASEVRTEGYTVQASLDVLVRALRPLYQPESPNAPLLSSDDTCSLRISHPSPDTLGRLINACSTAEDYPGTLGFDSSCNRYVCKKTIRDIWTILQHLADYDQDATIQGNFSVYEMSSETTPF